MGSFVPCAPAASPTYCRRILTSRPTWCWIPQSMARELRRLQRRAPIALTDRCWGSGTCSERHIVISYGCWVARRRPPRDSSVRCEGGWEGGRFVRADVEGGSEGGRLGTGGMGARELQMFCPSFSSLLRRSSCDEGDLRVRRIAAASRRHPRCGSDGRSAGQTAGGGAANGGVPGDAPTTPAGTGARRVDSA